MITSKKVSLKSKEYEMYVMSVDRYVLAWNADRDKSRAFQWWEIPLYILYIKIRFGHKVSKSTLISISGEIK